MSAGVYWRRVAVIAMLVVYFAGVGVVGGLLGGAGLYALWVLWNVAIWFVLSPVVGEITVTLWEM